MQRMGTAHVYRSTLSAIFTVTVSDHRSANCPDCTLHQQIVYSRSVDLTKKAATGKYPRHAGVLWGAKDTEMVNIVPVSRDRHADKGWRRPTGYSFAAAEAVVPLTGAEFASAAVAMPIAFIEKAGRYMPVAVMSPVSGRNMFVAPAGQWLGTYMPARLRSYPFLLLRGEGSDQMLLCVDEDSGLVVEANAETEAFFAEDGSPSSAVKPLLEFLQQVEHNRLATELAVAGLADAGVIQPWALTIPAGDKQLEVKGLHRVDPAKLAALEDGLYLKLRKSSAIELAYTQMLSMQMVRIFLQLAAIQKQMAPPRQSPPLAFDQDGII